MTNTKRLIKFGEYSLMIKLQLVEHMTMGCLLLTDSGGTQNYVAGLLDNGKPFIKRCPRTWETR